MEHEHIIEGRSSGHPNRFIAHVEVQGEQVTAHIGGTGCCRELLIPRVIVLLQYHPGVLEAGRKIEYSLIGVYKGDILTNMDFQAPNQVAERWLRTNGFTGETGTVVSDVRREATYGNSRLDLIFLASGEQAYMEVKGVTLEVDHVAGFPDTPTEHGIKHVKELVLASKYRPRVCTLFVIRMRGITSFMPSIDTHSTLEETLQEVPQADVHTMACDCIVTKEELSTDQSIEVFIHKN